MLSHFLIHTFVSLFFCCLSVSLCGSGESDDAYLSISGDCRLLRVTVLLESGQQEKAADALRPSIQPTLQFRTQEIRYCGRPKDIRLRCCFYPGCLTSKGRAGVVYYMCVCVCVQHMCFFLRCCVGIEPLKGKWMSSCWQGVAKGLEKKCLSWVRGHSYQCGPNSWAF